MPFSPTSKRPGDIIQSVDWNAAMDEIKRLETDKLNSSGGEISGALTVGNAVTSGTEAALVVRHNGSFAWGNALSINQVAQGNSDGPKIRFQRTVGAAQSWSAGILNGINARHFAILEDTSAGYGNPRLVIAPGGNVGVGINDPKAKLHVSGGSWDLTSAEGDLAIGTAAHRLKIGVATGGTGAGDVRIRAHGGTNRLFLGGGTSDTLTVGVNTLSIDGIMSIKGTPTEAGVFSGEETQFFRGKIGAETVTGNCLNLSLGKINLPQIIATGQSYPRPPYLLRIGHLEEQRRLQLGGSPSIVRTFNPVMTLDQNGLLSIDGTLKPGGADFAELFESENGEKIPVGITVAFGENGKIRPAVHGETPIGVISGSPAILGNSPMYWPRKYERDEYGTPKIETVQEILPVSDEARRELEILTEEGKVLSSNDRERLLHPVPSRRKVLNPDYDPTRHYEPRENRPEWQIVGLLGQIRITKGQPTAPSWVKIKDISENVELWLVK